MTFATLARLVEDLAGKIGGYRGASERADSAEYLDWAMKCLAQRCCFYSQIKKLHQLLYCFVLLCVAEMLCYCLSFYFFLRQKET